VDCVHLARAVYEESGFKVELAFPPYQLDEGSHNSKSKLMDFINESERFADVGTLGPMIGDLLVFNMGHSPHHVGVKITPTTFINAIKRFGVVESNLGDSTWTRRLVHVFRPMEIYFTPA
jgi:cell wall-associated NlpC family hydrolase